MKKRICIALIGLWLSSSSSFAQETLSISSVQGSEGAELSALILKQAYEQLDISIKFFPMNAYLGLEVANAGELDGVLARINGINSVYPYLIPVAIPIYHLELGAFSTRYDPNIKDWYSLTPYKVGIIKGMLLAERNSEALEIERLNNYTELIEALLAGTIDVAVMPRSNGRKAIKSLGTTEIVDLGVVLENALLYHHLHQRHRELVPRIEAVLKIMLLDGTIQRLRTQVTPPVVDFDFDKSGR